MKTSTSSGVSPASAMAFLAAGASVEARPLEHRGSLLPEGRPRGVRAIPEGEPEWVWVMRWAWSPSVPQDGGPDPRGLRSTHDGGPCTVAEDEGDGPVGRVDDVGHALGADHQTFPAVPARTRASAWADAVAVPGAGRGDVVRRGGG